MWGHILSWFKSAWLQWNQCTCADWYQLNVLHFMLSLALSDWPFLYGFLVPDLAPVHTKYAASKIFHFSCHISHTSISSDHCQVQAFHPQYWCPVQFLHCLYQFMFPPAPKLNSLSSIAMSPLIITEDSVFSCNKCPELPLKNNFKHKTSQHFSLWSF